MEILTSVAFTLISVWAVFYGWAVYRYMRERVKAAQDVGNGRLALARGIAATTARQTLVAILAVVIGALVSVRDVLGVLAGEPFIWTPGVGVILRLLFIALILLIADGLRIKKRTYIRSESSR